MEKIPTSSSCVERITVPHYLVRHDPVVTLNDVEKKLGVSRRVMVKTLLFQRADTGQYVLVALRGNDKIDRSKLARALEAERGDVLLVPRERVEQVIGLPFGGLRPFGHDPEKFKVVFDRAILENRTVFCSAGEPTQTLVIKPRDLVKISEGICRDICLQGD
ncbi:MAG TPA: hypothetical protein DEV73_03375 [Candidatus Zambryskibacteria bacterium]|uniref:YbaK/aminoacyl-tRNA synthetase-associated domain-containing protein n=1 Tax=Candidatus Blackburnbacteria bacterium RIFCSPLOWO2_01_FULL_40_20 TaxID=1797519 RepID=A0A1G1VAJ4_9BACT|nr:MAG: hypothetical protein A2694_03015 [Candidatus Blackburnbacteria bacterium RIFCSPHIGHO2_01_FULL_40_17]OGY09910.1 MAG: hypothetical protein A3D24_04395 [Candidatus Blackburnbacteria bacterium RIFCSPHIGHO2_02_FULL_39_13]OGY12504.1 MAG: hypothetical protein A3A77_00840 [Candidatus Blackburnbacteria bacterium RIFCSPLOWO2_01_FULL_40_20]OGY15808.1 MAG: hypothetical protein A3I52_03275 [Candidatus Blackburnbacteria bacterium RIFCSPLOWO2_02_FULL_40_10]HBL51986.1 hypothetical protein [Candidatus B